MARAYTTWSPELIADVLHLRARGLAYATIAEQLAESHNVNITAEAVRHIVRRNKDQAEFDPADADVDTLRAVRRTQRTNASVAKQNRAILDHLNEQQDIVAAIGQATASLAPRPKVKLRKTKKSGKTKMTIEAMISDVHVGKKTSTFNLDVCRLRLRQYTEVLIGEIERASKNYDVEKIILAFLGDIIENALMHGRESTMNCEFGNPEQVRWAIELFMQEVIEPVAALGIPVIALGITGNHDREEMIKTYNHPGMNSLTWVIYKSLQMLTERAGFSHVKWTIPDGIYTTLNIYGDEILYEHGDHVSGGNTKKAYTNHMVKRSQQLNTIIKGIRAGHFHEYACFDNGTIIVNASVPGQDSYADVLGFSSNAGQVINFYVKTANRQSSFYHSFLVQLGN
jgi:Icc-related predicted phosphoesterase